MHVRIQYDGPPDQFGWLLPVPADPTLEVKLSTEALFDSLDQLYAPRFIVQRNFEPGCAPPPQAEFAEDGAVANAGGGVNVVSREAVGPYDRVILEAQSVEELRSWLDEEEFFGVHIHEEFDSASAFVSHVSTDFAAQCAQGFALFLGQVWGGGAFHDLLVAALD